MEVEGLNRVRYEDLPGSHREWSERMWEIFDRGVRAAKAENERLGIVSDESVSYSDLPERESSKVAEKE